jgi:hypothetical protein
MLVSAGYAALPPLLQVSSMIERKELHSLAAAPHNALPVQVCEIHPTLFVTDGGLFPRRIGGFGTESSLSFGICVPSFKRAGLGGKPTDAAEMRTCAGRAKCFEAYPFLLLFSVLCLYRLLSL